MNPKILPLLEALIKIPSVSSDIEKLHEIVNFVEAEFSLYPNATIKKYEWNKKPSIVIQNFEGLNADIILNGHLDVVPQGEENQFEPVHRDEKIYARGAGDMKAGDAVMITIMQEVFENNFIDKKVSLILTCDEEIGGANGAKKIVEMGYTALDGVLVPDSGSTKSIVIAEKGIFDIEVEVRGKGGHSSRPWLSDNAIDKTIKLYEALRKYIQDDSKLYDSDDHWSSSVNLTRIESGTATNVIPESAKAYFDIRITQEFSDVKDFEKELRKICYNFDAEILELFHGDLVYTDPKNPFIQSYVNTCENILGEKPKITKEHGASDGRFFASKGMPVILHRPTCENIHSKGEYVQIESVEKIYEIYKAFIFGKN
ncbi:M20/M25/M40 family metallo-hydrolase [Candidatus Gracilibacteria bacterium]|nr:M20/M25/M40 family metallo-hydrolase [Candidatus Gracilibacteria bacterium]